MSDVPTSSQETSQPQPRRDRSTGWLIAGVFILTIAVAVLAALFLTEDDGDDVAQTSTTTTVAGGGVQRAPAAGGGTDGDGDTSGGSDGNGDGGGEVERGCDVGQFRRILEPLVEDTLDIVRYRCTDEGGGGASVAFADRPDPLPPGMAVRMYFSYFAPGDGGWTLITYSHTATCETSGLSAEACAALG